MDTHEILFTDIRRWKYRLDEQVRVRTDWYPPVTLRLSHFRLDPDSVLTLETGFMWDGPSGPTWDTPNWMLPSAVHDAFYRLLTEDLIPDRAKCRKHADDLMYAMLRERGMNNFRASYSWVAVRLSPWAVITTCQATDPCWLWRAVS